MDGRKVGRKLVEIKQQYGSVSISVADNYVDDYTLQHSDMPFTPLQQATFTEAAAAVAATRSYTGLLPLGRYSIGDEFFRVTDLDDVVTIRLGSEAAGDRNPSTGPFSGVILGVPLGYSTFFSAAVDLPLWHLPTRSGRYSTLQTVVVASLPYDYFTEAAGLQLSIADYLTDKFGAPMWWVLGSGVMGGTSTFWLYCEQTGTTTVSCGGAADDFPAVITAPVLMAPVLRIGLTSPWVGKGGRDRWAGLDFFLADVLFVQGWDEGTIKVTNEDGTSQQMEFSATELPFSQWGLAARLWTKF